MSTLYVDTITEKTAGNGVQIPGHVIQVVHNNQGIGQVNSTVNGTWFDSGLTVTITPSSASNWVYLMFNGSAIIQAANYYGTRLVRDSTVLTASTFELYSNDPSYWQGDHITQAFVDTPATTSAVVYKLQLIVNLGASNQVRWNYNSSVGSYSRAVAMEIAQ